MKAHFNPLSRPTTYCRKKNFQDNNSNFQEPMMMRKHLTILFLFLSVASVFPEDEPQFRKPVNCANIKDGNYVWGCSRFYSICTNGRELPMECYTGLKLNPDNNQCDSPANIAVCKDGSSSTLFRSKDPFTCDGKPDGSYEAGPCSNFYIQCSQGRRFDQTCPNGLIFNANAGVCDFASKCKKSRRRMTKKMHIAYAQQQPVLEDSFNNPDSPVPPQSPAHVYYGQNYQQPMQKNQQQTQADPPQQSAFSCAGKVDGIYMQQPGACGSQFYKCSNAQAFSYNCTNGLVYNEQNNQCDYPQYVVACGGTPPDSTTTPTPAPPINAPAFDCTGRADGLYADQNCNSSYFYSCVGGMSTAMQCSPGLVFDTLNNQCEYKESCGQPKTTMPPQQQDPVKPNLEHGTSGYYFGGKQYPNVAYGQQYPAYNGNQGQQVPQQSAAPGNQQPQNPSSPISGNSQQSQQQPSSSSPSFNCAGKQNGYYVKQPCTPDFFSCSNGVSTKVTCPGGLVFDVQNAQCEFQSACGQPGTSSNSSQPQSPSPPEQSNQQQSELLPHPQSPSSSAVQQQQMPQQISQQQATASGNQQPPTSPVASNSQQSQQPPSSSFNCLGKANGYYVRQSCTPVFFSCSNGMSTKVTCPGGLVFDVQKAQCEFENECGQSSASPNSPQAPQQPSAPVSQQQQAPPSVPESQPQNPPIDCGGRKDGFYYKHACQSSYITCASGNAIVQNCPGDTVFEPISAQCQFKAQCQQNNGNGQNSPTVAAATQMVPAESAPSPQAPAQSNVPNVAGNSSPFVPRQQTSPEATQIPSSSGSGFSCTGRKDGMYYQHSCRPNYIICSGGQTVRQRCPDGLVFDASVAQCEFAELCGKLIGNVPGSSPLSPAEQPSANQNQCTQCSPANQQIQPTNSASQTPSSSQQSSFSCQGKPNGNYLRSQCQPDYIVCSGGQAFPQRCPDGLVFDANGAQCEFPSQCGQNQPSQSGQSSQIPAENNNSEGSVQPSSSQPQQPSQQVQGPAQLTRRPALLPPSAMGFNCSRRIDGYYYRRACTPHFFTCVGGHATQLTCPGELVFDPSKALCQYPAVCGQSSQPDENGAEITVAQPPQPQTDFNCQGRRNGYYVRKGCTPQFYTCLGGIATKLTCPGNLVFDVQSASCQYPEICAAQQEQSTQGGNNQVPPSTTAGNSPVVPQTPQPQQPQFPQSQPQTPEEQSIPSPVVPPQSNFNCAGKENGPYPMGQCSNQYTICSNGFAHLQTCPGQLVFSPAANNSCEFMEVCQSGLNSISPGSPNEEQPQEGTIPNRFEYKRTYQRRFSGQVIPSQQNVPNGQNAPSAPSNAQSVPQPSASVPNQQIPPNAPANQAPSQGVQGQQLPPRPQNQPSPVVQAAATICSAAGNNSEGFHAQGCSNQFYACSGGVTTQMNCPVGLFFDEDTQQCDMRDVVVACGGKKSVNQEQPGQEQATTTTSSPATTVHPSEFDCSKRAIGYYGKGCNPRYYSCTGISTYAFECPSGLKYDQEAAQCDYANNIPDCGGQRPTTPAPVVPSQEAPGNGQPQQAQSGGNPNGQPQPMSNNATHPQQPVTNPCSQLPNGSYGPSCSPYYFTCYSGVPYDYLCPDGYVYSIPSAQCLPSQQVPSCSSG